MYSEYFYNVNFYFDVSTHKLLQLYNMQLSNTIIYFYIGYNLKAFDI